MSNYAPIFKEIVVNTSQERAFSVFTGQIDRWWPRDAKIGKVAMTKLVLETRANGRWYEVGADNSECDWGKVILWEPPHRVILAWQISGDLRFDPNLVTEVEITFQILSERQTRVTLEHRNIERFGEKATKMRASMDAPSGWQRMLGRFGESSAED